MRATMWFLLPSDGVFRHSSTSLQYYLTRQGRHVVLRGGDVIRPPLERRLNWVPDPAPTPAGDHGKENHPPSSEPQKLPRKMRPRRRKREHHQRLPGATGSAPGTNQPPRGRMITSVKHPLLPQLPQHPQPPRSAANENSSRANLPDKADHGRLYKRAQSSISKESTSRSCRDNFSGSTLSFSSKRSHRDYFSGSPYRAMSLASALTLLVNGSGHLHGALRDRGLPHLPLLAVLESIHLPFGEGVSNSLMPYSINSMTKSLILTLFW